MAVAFFLGGTSGRWDLNVFFVDGAGASFDPYEVTYDLYLDEGGVLTAKTTTPHVPVNPAPGEYYAVETFPSTTYVEGDYRIRWRWRVESGGPVHVESSEFALIDSP